MPLAPLNKIPAIAIGILLFFGNSGAEGAFPFQGIVKVDDINIRSDSTVNAEPICSAKKGQELIVISESYDWYKIRLPETAPSYINKELVVCIDEFCRDARVRKDKVRIRLKPDKSSSLLGIAQKDQLVHVLAKSEGWYKIQPIENSFGWIHKKFVESGPVITKVPVRETPAVETPVTEVPAEQIIPIQLKQEQPKINEQEEVGIIGIIAPYGKVLGRKATHKLISQDKEIFLLKGDKKELDSLNYRKLKVTGRQVDLPKKNKYAVIEVKQVEVLK